MKKTNYTSSIGTVIGNYLDNWLYANRRNVTEEGFGKSIGKSAKTIQRWRYNGISTTQGVDLVLQAMGVTIRDIFEDEDAPDFLCCEVIFKAIGHLMSDVTSHLVR